MGVPRGPGAGLENDDFPIRPSGRTWRNRPIDVHRAGEIVAGPVSFETFRLISTRYSPFDRPAGPFAAGKSKRAERRD